MNPAFYDLIAKVLSHEATPEETADFRATCAADPALQTAFEEAQNIWHLADKAIPVFKGNKAAAWVKIQARIGVQDFEQQTIGLPQPTRRIALASRIRWAAAAAVIGLGISFALWQKNNQGELSLTATQNRQMVLLPDGSTVTLQKDATLRYTKAFGQKETRQIALKGKAFFEVTKDAEHPFVISAEKLKITVVGTSFTVNSKGAEVSVRTGKVKVSGGENAEEIFLQPGEEGTLVQGHLQKVEADSNEFFLKTGRLSFSNKSFAEIISDISRLLEVPVQLDASVSPAGRAQAVTYSATVVSVENVLTDLCRITGYQWRRDATTGAYNISQAR